MLYIHMSMEPVTLVVHTNEFMQEMIAVPIK